MKVQEHEFIIKQITSKAHNRRLCVTIFKDKEGHLLALVESKRLHDFKARNIVYSKQYYTIESLLLLMDLLNALKRHDNMINKVVEMCYQHTPKYITYTNPNTELLKTAIPV